MNKKTYTYQDLVNLFEDGINRITKFESVPDDALTLKPGPTSWNAAEIFDHITKFNDIYLGYIEQAFQSENPAKADTDSFKPRFLFHYFIQFLEPPYKMKMKTITPMYPVNENNTDYRVYFSQAKKTNQKIIRLINDAKEKKLDLNRVKGKNSVFKIKMTLAEFFLICNAHQQRHFWQAEQTLLKLTGEKY